MEQDVISELRLLRYSVETIESLLLALIVLILVVFVAFLYVVFLGRRNKSPDNAALEKEQFFKEAQLLYDSGSFRELLSLSIGRSNDYPHDPYALWFAGLSLYKQNQLGKALALFNDLQRIDPAWNKDTVLGYIEDIKSRMGGPKGV